MARVTITSVEEVTVCIYTEFSYDTNEVAFDPTQASAWDLNGEAGVEKIQYSRQKPSISEAEADTIYRHGYSNGALMRQIQVQQGDYEYDSMSAVGMNEPEVDTDFAMDARQLLDAKAAIDGALARLQHQVLSDLVPEAADVEDPIRPPTP
jgi:hypothetical protein